MAITPLYRGMGFEAAMTRVMEGIGLEPLLTAKEAAKILGVDKRMVYRLIEKGDIPAVKIGKVWRIEPKELKEFINRGGEAV